MVLWRRAGQLLTGKKMQNNNNKAIFGLVLHNTRRTLVLLHSSTASRDTRPPGTTAVKTITVPYILQQMTKKLKIKKELLQAYRIQLRCLPVWVIRVRSARLNLVIASLNVTPFWLRRLCLTGTIAFAATMWNIPVRVNTQGAEGASGAAVIWRHLSNESHHRRRRTALASYARRRNLILIHFPPLIRVLFQKAVYFPGERRRWDYLRPEKTPRFLIMSPDHS